MESQAKPRPSAGWVIETLVGQWRARPTVEAVLLFGSHAHGLATESSDIDLSILSSDPALLSGAGLFRFQGHLVEVFFNTRGFYEGTFAQFHADNSRIAQSQFASARILFDRHGEGAALQQAARVWLEEPRAPQSTRQAEWAKRVIWLSFHRLEHAAKLGRPALGFALHGFIYDVYARYAAFMAQPVMPADRLEAYLADAAKRESYLQDPFPDADFRQTLLQAVREVSEAKRFDLARQLRDRALHGMGGFEPSEMAGAASNP